MRRRRRSLRPGRPTRRPSTLPFSRTSSRYHTSATTSAQHSACRRVTGPTSCSGRCVLRRRCFRFSQNLSSDGTRPSKVGLIFGWGVGLGARWKIARLNKGLAFLLYWGFDGCYCFTRTVIDFFVCHQWKFSGIFFVFGYTCPATP